MGSYYEIMHRRREKKDLEERMAQANGDSQPASEQTPLLRSDE